MKLFVTGGTGFFGKALLRHWAAQPALLAGSEVTLLSRRPEAYAAQHARLLEGLPIRLVAGDMQRPETLPRGERFTHVLHAATDSTTGPQLHPLDRYEQIVEGTRAIYDFALACGAERVLHTSSGGVYGPTPPTLEKLPEDYHGMPDPLQAENAYSVGKRVAEHLSALYAARHGLQTVTARCFAFVGEDLPLDVHFAIGNFMRDAIAGADITVKGDGTPMRSYLDQRDLAHWLMVLLQQGRPGQAYNVGSDEAVSIGDLAHLVARLAGRGSAVRILSAPDSKASVRNRYVPSIDKARRELGLDVTYRLEAAIAHAMARLPQTPSA